MTDFEDLLHQIEDEAEAVGPAGRAHFDELRDRCDLVVQITDRRRELHPQAAAGGRRALRAPS